MGPHAPGRHARGWPRAARAHGLRRTVLEPRPLLRRRQVRARGAEGPPRLEPPLRARAARRQRAGRRPRILRAMTFPLDGGCDCKTVRYRMETKPLFVHCCHCRWCQRETGASFALNAMIETDRLTVLNGDVDLVLTPSDSGKGQKI